MTEPVDLVIIGMGSGGMTAAEFAAQVGLRVVVIERHRVGGDCLWTGCVPSKALIAAAKVAHHLRHADRFGLPPSDAAFDLSAVWARVRSVREELARGDDDPARFVAMGIDVRFGQATLTAPDAVTVTRPDGTSEHITTRFTLLCTGSRPAIPAIPGLTDVGHLTSESIFELEAVPRRMVFIGGGPIAVELAQACHRLGVDVTVLQKGPGILPRDEPELAARLLAELRAEGLDLRTGVQVSGVEPGPIVVGSVDGVEHRWETDAVVVAAGRTPVLDGLGLDAVGVVTNARGVVVDDRLRSSVPSVYAAGDVAGRELFTHAAGYQAVRAVRDAFFPGRGRADAAVPWATFTSPELAHAGLTSDEAVDRFGRRRVAVHRWSLEHNDRAHADGTAGALVLVERTGRLRSRLVGAHVLADGAGELIGELSMAIDRRWPISRLGGLVHVYPTIATSIQQVGGRAAMATASRYRWLVRGHRRRQTTSSSR